MLFSAILSKIVPNWLFKLLPSSWDSALEVDLKPPLHPKHLEKLNLQI
jgi:hypothetical protein